jgi:predicted HTH transcriptional regulator
MFSKAFEALDEDALARLLETPAEEEISLEFKREMYGRGAGDIKEMLRDIASMANAEGGFLIIGLDQDINGRATSWFNVPNANVEASRLVQSANDAIADRILGLRARAVAVSGGDAVVVQIPRSF